MSSTFLEEMVGDSGQAVDQSRLYRTGIQRIKDSVDHLVPEPYDPGIKLTHYKGLDD